MEAVQVIPDTVIGDRVLLRTWRQSDVADLARLVARNLDHLSPWMPWAIQDQPDLDERRAIKAEWEEGRLAGGDAYYGVFVDGVAVGGTGLHRRVGPDGLEIGYWIDRDHTRRGLASEAVRVLTDAAFGLDWVQAVEVHHDVANLASGGVPPKVGYRMVQDRLRRPLAPGELGVERVWRVTREEWARLSARVKAAR